MRETDRELIGAWAREGRRDLPRPALELLDRRLVELGRGVGGMRLRMGEALEAFARCGGPHEMGFPGLGAYARERCARSEHWAADSRALARRVEGLPAVREAVLAGRLSWSQAELVVRVATPEEEAAWVEEAEGLTVRALKQRVQSGQAQASTPDHEEEDEAPPRRIVQVTVDREDAWAFEATRMLVSAVTGGAGTDAVVEAMLAEGLTALMEARPDLEVPEGLDPEEARLAAEWRAQVDQWRREAEVACEERIPEVPTLECPAVEDEPLPEGVRELDRHVRRLAAELGARDLEMGDAARALFQSNGWRRRERRAAVRTAGLRGILEWIGQTRSAGGASRAMPEGMAQRARMVETPRIAGSPTGARLFGAQRQRGAVRAGAPGRVEVVARASDDAVPAGGAAAGGGRGASGGADRLRGRTVGGTSGAAGDGRRVAGPGGGTDLQAPAGGRGGGRAAGSGERRPRPAGAPGRGDDGGLGGRGALRAPDGARGRRTGDVRGW